MFIPSLYNNNNYTQSYPNNDHWNGTLMGQPWNLFTIFYHFIKKINMLAPCIYHLCVVDILILPLISPHHSKMSTNSFFFYLFDQILRSISPSQLTRGTEP